MKKEVKPKEEVIEEKDIVKEKKPVKGRNGGTVILLSIIVGILLFIVGVLLGMNYNKDTQKKEEETKEERKKFKSEKEEEKTEDEEEDIPIIIRPTVDEPVDAKREAEEKDNKKDEEEEEITPTKSTKKYNNIVDEAKDLIPFAMCGYPSFPLEKKTVTVSELDAKTKIRMVIHRYATFDPEQKTEITTKEISRFFADTSFLDSLKKDSVDLVPGILSYKGGDKFLLETYASGCEGAYEGENLHFVKSTQEGNTLKLEYVYYWTTYNYEENFESISKTEKGKPVYDKVVYNEEKKEYQYKGKPVDYSVFDKYTFVFDTSNNNLRFQKVIYQEAK